MRPDLRVRRVQVAQRHVVRRVPVEPGIQDRDVDGVGQRVPEPARIRDGRIRIPQGDDRVLVARGPAKVGGFADQPIVLREQRAELDGRDRTTGQADPGSLEPIGTRERGDEGRVPGDGPIRNEEGRVVPRDIWHVGQFPSQRRRLGEHLAEQSIALRDRTHHRRRFGAVEGRQGPARLDAERGDLVDHLGEVPGDAVEGRLDRLIPGVRQLRALRRSGRMIGAADQPGRAERDRRDQDQPDDGADEAADDRAHRGRVASRL